MNPPVSREKQGKSVLSEFEETLVVLAEDARIDEMVAAREKRLGRPRKQRRAAQREAALPGDRMCRGCGGIFLRSRQWVVIRGVARCLKCNRSGR